MTNGELFATALRGAIEQLIVAGHAGAAAATGRLAELVGSVREVALVAEGAHAAVHVVFAEGDFEVLVRDVVVLAAAAAGDAALATGVVVLAVARSAVVAVAAAGRIVVVVVVVVEFAAVLGDAEAEVRDDRSFVGRLLVVAVAARQSVDAEALLVKYTSRLVVLGDVAVRTVRSLAVHAPAAQWHSRQVVLMQKFALLALHAQSAEPVSAHDRRYFSSNFWTDMPGGADTEAASTAALRASAEFWCPGSFTCGRISDTYASVSNVTSSQSDATRKRFLGVFEVGGATVHTFRFCAAAITSTMLAFVVGSRGTISLSPSSSLFLVEGPRVGFVGVGVVVLSRNDLAVA
eukprot:CAMPEP_0198653860 /NCGR_PEP_ID=MMETSP1467-20131203/7329_1 /TAXON_ID=1462469 /ORGANISM="unid. sp., Strain CCMP2135" /LENGTH=347 /DNA_ID=CAMNT_0044389835 /DNA_START=85 /DNA_END=1127 /DNA_ORIENTATION=-